MMKMDIKFIGLTVVLIVCTCVSLSAGSAWLQDPPSRSALWMYGIKATPNYDFRNLNCGNEPVQIEADGSRNCGICGDPIADPTPRPNENGGKYANPIIRTRYFESGSVVDISVRNNLAGISGWFYEFRLCTDGNNPTQECLNQNLLTIEESNTTNVDVPAQTGTHVFHVQLPAGVTCSRCLFQWRFRKGKSVEGCDFSNWCGLGRGPQIEFYNCADIIIGAVGQPKPTDQSVLWEPRYDGVAYGSAYEVATTLTTSGGSTRAADTTTHHHTTASPTTSTRFNVITIPTAFPPTGTTLSPANGPTNSDRLVVNDINSSGNIIALSGSNSRTNNAQLLLLLGLLPLLGAASLRDNKPLPVPPIAPSGFWVKTPPMTEYYLGANIGFGNFGSNGIGSYGDSGQYGTSGKSYGSQLSKLGGSGYTGYNGNQQVIGRHGFDTIPQLADADFVNTNVQLREMVQNNGNIMKSGSNQFTGNTYPSSNTGVWNNAAIGNTGFNNHAYPASGNTGFNNAYPSTSGVHHQAKHVPYQQRTPVYGPQTISNTGYQPHPVQPVQRNNVWSGNGGGTLSNNFIKNNNNNNLNGLSTGQQFPAQGTIPQTNFIPSGSQSTGGSQGLDLPGIAPASRLLQSPRTITLTPGTDDRNGFVQNRNNSPNGRQRMVHDWYNQLMGYFPSTDIVPR